MFLAFLVASAAATVVVVVALMSMDSRLDAEALRAWAGAAPMMLPFVAATALVPTVIVVTFAEVRRMRSFWFYAIGGVAIAIVSLLEFAFVLSLAGLVKGPYRPLNAFTLIFLVAGVAAGLVYWTLAGRNAGRWREPRARA
jgi:uncharacterized membrane protein